MKKKQNKSKKFGIIALTTFTVAIILAVVGMSTTMRAINEVVISKSPTAILANAGLSEEKDVFLPVAYFDQREDACVNMYDDGSQKAVQERQFEWSECGYLNKEMEQGLVEFELAENYLPVGVSGKLTPNRGINTERWFSEMEGKSASYTGDLKMNYKADGAEFVFYQSKFYPLDEAKFSADDEVNRDGHNHLFTMNFAVPFTVLLSGEESFEVRADDDTFVFIGDKLAIDMGGIHDATSGRFVIHENGEVYTAIENEDLAFSGITVEADAGSIVRIFHADRDSTDSTFGVKFAGMNLVITNAELANHDGGVQIAYDPTDPSYVAPLGESSVVKPDNTKGFIVIATIEGVMVVVFAVLLLGSIRYLRRVRTQE